MPPPPRPFHSLLLLFLSLIHLSHANLRINVAGPALPSVGFYADLPQYLTNPNTVPLSIASSLVSVSGSWKPAYTSYRYAPTGDLEYKIPVPSGSFQVAVMFLESFKGASKPSVRVFDLKINGQLKQSSIDVFNRVGFGKPLFLSFSNISPVKGFITVTVARIPGKENPMISAIVITGPGAANNINTSGSSNPPVTTVPPPVTQPTNADPTCATGIFAKNKATGVLACCKKQCGKCGGPGCGSFAPGEKCCVSLVDQLKKSCDNSTPPCTPSIDLSQTTPTTSPPTTSGDPKCATGIFGKNSKTNQLACCKNVCGKCGGSGCSKFAPGELCCISSVFNQKLSCDTNMPPCTPSEDLTTSQPVTTTPPSTTILTPVEGVSCPVSGATTNSFRLNIAAGPIASAFMGADNPDYIISSDKGLIFSAPSIKISAASGPKPWDAAYSSHRWTKSSVLSYKIPVPAGSYTVKLMFAETYFNKVGARTFDVFINGVEKKNNLDVFKTVGMNVGLLLSFAKISSQAGHITITLIKTVENPMISGILIEGPNAGQIAVGGGCSSSGDKADTEDLNGGFNHRAHSVPGGDYLAIDYNGDGKAFVTFDGTQSHSHYSDPGPPAVTGKIVSYKWTWEETVDGKKVQMVNNDKSGKFIAPFPIGVTVVTLEVVDQTGDVAVDTTKVDVKGSATNGAYCYFYNYGSQTFATVPLPQAINSDPKPTAGGEYFSLNFNSGTSFADLPFKANSFAVRCQFFIDIKEQGEFSYTVQHEGPFKLYHAGVVLGQSNSKGSLTTKKKLLQAGLNVFQLLYFRPKNLSPKLVMLGSSGPLSSPQLQHDSATTLPIIKGLSKTSSVPSGGQNIQIFGSAFINGVSVKFGEVEATNLITSDAGVVQVTVPPGSGVVPVTVVTNAGTSNKFSFTYTSEDTLDQPVIFKETSLKNEVGGTYEILFIAAATYGPDGRLYLGSTASRVFALGVDKDYKVTSKCEQLIGNKRSVLGVTFSPFSNALKMYFTTNSLYWKDKSLLGFEEGWPNGNVETIEFSKTILEGKGCAFNQQKFITGLPVSNHDHGVNKLQFLPNGELLISIGGFTNGGISIPGKKPVSGDAPDDKLGGVASNPLSAAIISCPGNTKTFVKYNNYANPEIAKIVSGGACKVYASGMRNSFGMTLHTNGEVYATDNGPNAGFGDFSTDCSGGKKSAKNIPDKLFKIEKGKYHGHPNLNRKECEHYPASAVQPLIGNLKSSSNGIIEYRSNTFGGEIKGNLYISKFSIQNAGVVSQVKLGGTGGDVGYAPSFLPFSGLNIVEGPRGEFVMPRVYQKKITIGVPTYPDPKVTFMLGVHPKRGPASGGTQVLISGHNFGSNPKASFGGKSCNNIKVIDDESFTCVTPPNSKNKQVSVVVSGAIGNSPTYGSDYWYF